MKTERDVEENKKEAAVTKAVWEAPTIEEID
jgi:hypothetical protein